MNNGNSSIPRRPVFGRRQVLWLAGLASAASLGAVRRLVFAAPPKEAGLSFEGLLKNLPGFQPRELAPLPRAALAGLLSKQQLERNYGVYKSALAQLLEAERALALAPRDAAHSVAYALLRKQQVAAANAVLLHEFYLRNLAPAAVVPSRYIMANMREHMGSLDAWREDFIACARVAEEWAVLVYDPYDDRWHNTALSASAAGGWIGGNPLIVCAVAEHAWSPDYPDRATYIARFLDHLDWGAVAERYRAVDRQ